MNLFQSPIVDHINYDNFALSISNLYAIRPIMWLIAQGMYIQAVSVFFAMVASLLFHLIQYDEHVQFIFTDVAPLSGSIFKGGQLAAPILRQRLLSFFLSAKLINKLINFATVSTPKLYIYPVIYSHIIEPRKGEELYLSVSRARTELLFFVSSVYSSRLYTV